MPVEGEPLGKHPLPQPRRQHWALGQRICASLSVTGTTSVPHSKQFAGMTNTRSEPSRRSTMGPSTSGITSPAQAMGSSAPAAFST
jgi:hypothetical protein